MCEDWMRSEVVGAKTRGEIRNRRRKYSILRDSDRVNKPAISYGNKQATYVSGMRSACNVAVDGNATLAWRPHGCHMDAHGCHMDAMQGTTVDMCDG